MDIIDWIASNKLDGTFIVDKIYKIENIGKFLIMDKKNLIIDNEFKLIFSCEEDELIFHVDYFVFFFGSKWYYTSKDSATAVLTEFKYLGKQKPVEDYGYSNLGIHGKYELMNGSRDYKDWCKKAKFLGMSSLAIAEKNTLAGALYFQQACKENDIKPIIGMTLSVISDKYIYEIKLYVKNKVGWKSILKINKLLQVDYPKGVPVELLKNHCSGLICVIGGSTIISKIDQEAFKYFDTTLFQINLNEWNNDTKEKEYLENYKSYFNSNLLQIYSPVFIHDSYYLDNEDNRVKEILNKIGDVAFNNSSKDQGFKTIEEIIIQFNSLFKEESGEEIFWTALENNLNIVEQCNFVIKRDALHLPNYEMNEEEAKIFVDSEDLFYDLISKGFDEKIAGLPNELEYLDRIEREIAVLKEGNVIDYFLILWDVVRFSKENNIQLSTGRGSSAGSLIAYLLSITNIDPIKYGLLFERFLNKARLLTGSMPDIDHDCPSNKREAIITYLRTKYGANNTALIGTHSNLKLKSLVKELLKLKRVEFSMQNIISSFFNLDLTFQQTASKTEMFKIALQEPKLMDMIINYHELFEIIDLMIFAPKSHSIHAAGIIITPKHDQEGNLMNVWDYVPIRLQNGVFVTEFEKEHCEQIGLLKDDILGLSQLDKISHIIDLISKNNDGYTIDIHKDISLHEPSVYKLFQKGLTEDIFQFNTDGMKKYCKDLQPTCIEDLIAANSLYRPGAMESGTHTKFVKIKNGLEPREDLIGLEDILADTHGVMAFQEHAMLVYQRLTDCDLNEADDFRKIITKTKPGKKNKDIERFETAFKAGYMKIVNNEKYVEEVWIKLINFSKYSFNKSHSAAYSVLAYYTAWFKEFHPLEFYSSALEFADDKSRDSIIGEIFISGKIKLNPPEINKSINQYVADVENQSIYWSLNGIASFGEKTMEKFFEERKTNGKFFSFDEFLSRMKGKGINKKVCYNLIISGAFDEIENIQYKTDRNNIIKRYNNFYNDEQKTNLGESNLDLLQINTCGYGFINYKNIAIKHLKNPYLTIAEINGYADDKDYKIVFSTGGIIDEIIVRPGTKGGEFMMVKINQNNQFIRMFIWSKDHKNYLQLKEELKLAKGKIFITNSLILEPKKEGKSDFATAIVFDIYERQYKII